MSLGLEAMTSESPGGQVTTWQLRFGFKRFEKNKCESDDWFEQKHKSLIEFIKMTSITCSALKNFAPRAQALAY